MKPIFSILARNLIAPLLKKFFIKEIKGEENIPQNTNFILAPNHQSYFDHFFAPLPIKDKLEKTHFIGKLESKWQALEWDWFYWLTETIPINRKAKDKRKVLEKTLKILEKEGIIIIYPEGKRNKKKELLPGKTGVAELAIKSGCPVVPLGLIYKNDNPPSIPVVIRIGRPIYFKKSQNSGNLKEITDKIMKEIASLSNKKYYGLHPPSIL